HIAAQQTGGTESSRSTLFRAVAADVGVDPEPRTPAQTPLLGGVLRIARTRRRSGSEIGMGPGRTRGEVLDRGLQVLLRPSGKGMDQNRADPGVGVGLEGGVQVLRADLSPVDDRRDARLERAQ